MNSSLPIQRFCCGVVLAGACGLLVSIAGCGGSNEGVAKGTATTNESKAKPEKGESKRPKSDGAKANGTAGGPKSIDGIPYDVFFDKPQKVADNTQTGSAPNTAVASAPNTTVAANDASKGPPATDTPTTAKEAPKDAGGPSLKDIIDKDALTNEIKNVRNYLAGKTTSVSTYNSSLLEIAPEAATLAVLAVAVSKSPDDFSWKKNAKYVRDLSWKIGEITLSKDGKTKNSFDTVSEAFAKIDDILKGSEPAGLPDAEADKAFGDAVGGNLVAIMKRIKKSEEVLKTTISSESGLKKESEKTAQEGAVLTFLGSILSAPGFGWDGDAEFAKFAQPLIEGGKQITEAAKSGNFALYGEGIIKVSKSCNECHPKFKP